MSNGQISCELWQILLDDLCVMHTFQFNAFWSGLHKDTDRETCACKMHENTGLKKIKLHQIGVTEEISMKQDSGRSGSPNLKSTDESSKKEAFLLSSQTSDGKWAPDGVITWPTELCGSSRRRLFNLESSVRPFKTNVAMSTFSFEHHYYAFLSWPNHALSTPETYPTFVTMHVDALLQIGVRNEAVWTWESGSVSNAITQLQYVNVMLSMTVDDLQGRHWTKLILHSIHQIWGREDLVLIWWYKTHHLHGTCVCCLRSETNNAELRGLDCHYSPPFNH